MSFSGFISGLLFKELALFPHRFSLLFYQLPVLNQREDSKNQSKAGSQNKGKVVIRNAISYNVRPDSVK